MAQKAANLRHLESGLLVASIATLANGDNSGAIDAGLRAPEVALQVTGTFGAGGSAQLEKSNDGAAWVIVGTALTSTGIVEGVTAARFLRVNVTAGDGTTALVAILVMSPIRG